MRTTLKVLAGLALSALTLWLFLHNLDDKDQTVDLSMLADEAESPNDVLGDRDYGDPDDFSALPVAGFGYRWIRRRTLQ